MSSNLNKELDELMLKVDSMDSSEEEEDTKQEPDTPEEVESEESSEPAPEEVVEPEGEEEIGLKVDEIDYPESDNEEQEMDAEAEKLPELSDIVHGGEGDDEKSEEDEGEEDSDSRLSGKLLGLKQNSLSGMMETIASNFKEKHPEHEVCCIMKDKIISLVDGQAFQTGYENEEGEVKLGQPIRAKELEERKTENDAIIAKLLKFDNI